MLARGLTARGHKVIVATDVDASPEFDRGLEYEVQRGRSVTQLARVARACDLVHASGASLVSGDVAIRARRPLVTTHHGLQASCLEGSGWHGGALCNYNLFRCIRLTQRHLGVARCVRKVARFPAGRMALRLARANVAVSGFVGRVVDAPRTVVVYNCADTAIFQPGVPSGPRTRFLFVGRFQSEKGVETLLHAVAKARSQRVDLFLDLVGGGPMEGSYRDLARLLGVEDRVRFLGWMRGSRLAEVVRASIALVLPTFCDEAFGIAAAEALCCGRVAIVSDRGGLPEVVQGMETVVPAGDVDAWAVALQRVDEDKNWRAEQEKRAVLAAARFTPGRFLDGYLQVYENAFSGSA